MGITNSNKQISTDHINCDGTLEVTLALSAAPDISENPTDIVLVLDRSGSMSGKPLADMKVGAETFIDIIDESTDGSQDGHIGSGSHIGIVSFSDTATVNAPLITSVAALKTAVNSLSAGGSTNHADAFTKAMNLFDPTSSNAKVIVMFTDGNTTAGAPPTPVAEAAKASGIVIYCIGLVGSDGIDVNALNSWATAPASSHTAITPDSGDLEELFEDLAKNISKPGATNIVIDEIINSEFAIVSIQSPNKGTASMINSTTIQWKISELGVTGNEGAELKFTIRHITENDGTKHVNQEIHYSDDENNVVIFPDPTVSVDCGIVEYPEECPEPVDLTIDGCEDSVVVDMGDVYLQSLGRIAQLSVNIKNVCPEKRVALAAILTEVDEHGLEYSRGMKAITIPAHHYPECRDVLVKSIKFVLPEDLNEAGEEEGAMCAERNFKARFIAHTIDTDFVCEEPEIQIV